MKKSSMSPLYHSSKVVSSEEDKKGTLANNFRERSTINIASRSDTIVAAPPKKLETKPICQDIDESAEAFIKKFRQQLLIQRLESIENYEQMLSRGL